MEVFLNYHYFFPLVSFVKFIKVTHKFDGKYYLIFLLIIMY